MNEENAELIVQVKPNASRNKITGFNEGILSMAIVAPPLKGKANQELVKYLSDVLRLPKSRFVIRKGATSKRKIITILGSNKNKITEIISQQLDHE